MISVPRDREWKRAPVGAGPYRRWLIDRGSLTARLARRCEDLRVDVVFQGRQRVHNDERFVVPAHAAALVREVLLRCGRTPVVFAHSVLRVRDLRGPWRGLIGLGNRPLGAALFADHRVSRYPLHCRRLGPGHRLYRKACTVLGKRPAQLWARRSLFVLGNSPILVTEVFLPGILKLAP